MLAIIFFIVSWTPSFPGLPFPQSSRFPSIYLAVFFIYFVGFSSSTGPRNVDMHGHFSGCKDRENFSTQG